MANKRQKKKKAIQQKYSLLERKGYTRKDIKRNKEEAEKVYRVELKKEKKRQEQRKVYADKKRFISENGLDNISLNSIWTKKPVAKRPTQHSSWEDLQKLLRKKKSDERYRARINSLISVGYDPAEIRKSWVSSNKSTQEYIARKQDINWNKVYITDNAIFFSFRDISQNCDLQSIIKNYLSMPIENLLEELQKIVSLPCTYDPDLHGGSSGKAGQAYVEYGSDDFVDKQHQYREVQNRVKHSDRLNRLKSKRKYKHSKYNTTYIPFQKLNGGHIHKTTLKNLVAIITAILNNVFEYDRRELYNNWYDIVTDIEPKIKKYIPSDY